MPRPPAKPAASQTIQVILPELTAWQRKFRDSKARFRIAACGRQVGKTYAAVIIAGFAASKGQNGWWIAPTYKLTNAAFDLMEKFFLQIPGVKLEKKRMRILFPNGGSIEFQSADDPQSLRSATLNFVVMDEAAFTPPEAWYDGAFHTLAVRSGWAMFLTSPFGKNWIYELFQRGKDPDFPDWESFNVTQYDNPYIPRENIEEAKRTMTERQFRREVLGEFVDAGGEVFPYVRRVATLSSIQSRIDGHEYAAGIDWGSRQDPTVISVWDATLKQQAAKYRIIGDNFLQQYRAVEDMCAVWRPRVVVAEENNIGQVHVQELTRRGLPIEPFNTNRYSKRDLIEAYASAMEIAAREDRPMLLNDSNSIKEHEAYESNVTSNGTTQYYAPPGFHDDEVIAASLGWRGVVGEPQTAYPSIATHPYTGLYQSTKNRSYPAWTRKPISKPR